MSNITIVVCTHNRAAGLRAALASLFPLATEGRFSYDILVVNNASTDTTEEVIAAAAAQSPVPLHGVYEPCQGITPARNRGVQEASGDWIAFFDDDQLADPRWLAELFCLAEEKCVHSVGGAVWLNLPKDARRQLRPTVRMLLGESDWSRAPALYGAGGSPFPGAGNWMLHRGVFAKIGAFRDCPGGRGEDTDLFRRVRAAGFKSWYVPTAIVHHVITPQRLEEPYLHRLARSIGEGVAEGEAQQWDKFSLVARWMLKLARTGLVYLPQWGVAELARQAEQSLDMRCLLAIQRAHHRRCWQLLKQAWLPPHPSPEALAAASHEV